MKVVRNESAVVDICYILHGECFEYENGIYIATDYCYDSKNRTAVNLETGSFEKFVVDGDKVRKVNAKVIVGDVED